MKHISTINPAIVKNRQSTHPSYWCKSGCVALTRCITTLRFASSSSNIWLTFQEKNSIRSILKYRTKTITRVLQIVTYVVKGERNGVQRRTKVNFMMQALGLLQLVKRHASGRSDVEQWKNQACSYSHY